jgi:type II restriction enzyme
MKYLTKSKKSPHIIKIIDEAVDILNAVGIPTSGKTERTPERMAMAFLAVAGVSKHWEQAVDNHFLRTRDIIDFNNEYFEEHISRGSYDDIRRKYLDLLVQDHLVLNGVADNPNAATNDPTRSYRLATDFMQLVKTYGTDDWNNSLTHFLRNKVLLKDRLSRKRDIDKVTVGLSNGQILELSAGEHNLLQKQIIEEFLPRYGKGSSLLYVGDTAKKFLHFDELQLKALQFFELSHGKLPDIIAYNSVNNWIYLIEAVHSSGAISEIRLLELQELTKNCIAEIIYVTAFLNRTKFKKWVSEIAWETEVWIADNPDHLIHFNGHKFLGPYLK